MDIGSYFVSLVALVPLVILASDFIKRTLKIEKGWLKQLIAWAVSVGLCLIGMWFDLGMFKDFTAVQTVAYGIATGLVANGVFDITIVQTLLDLILKFLKK
jgi:hypothetical protein